MNTLILKNHKEFSQAEGWRLFHAEFAGHWEKDGTFLVRKHKGHNPGSKLTPEELSTVLNEVTA